MLLLENLRQRFNEWSDPIEDGEFRQRFAGWWSNRVLASSSEVDTYSDRTSRNVRFSSFRFTETQRRRTAYQNACESTGGIQHFIG